jgi:hypothetical protein
VDWTYRIAHHLTVAHLLDERLVGLENKVEIPNILCVQFLVFVKALWGDDVACA